MSGAGALMAAEAAVPGVGWALLAITAVAVGGYLIYNAIESSEEEHSSSEPAPVQECPAGEDTADGETSAPKPSVPYPQDPTKPPGPDFEWRGKPGSKPGEGPGNWHNPKTGESLHPDLDHPQPIGPHYDYRAPNGEWYRWYPDGTMVPK